MGTRRLSVMCAAGLVVAGVLAGCSAGAPQVVPSGGATVSASSQPSSEPSSQSSDQPMPLPSPVETPTASPLPTGLVLPSRKPAPSGEQTLTGQVEAGVERGCLILNDATGVYQLLGGDPTVVYAGAQVSVTGHVVTGVMSYCMQGRPFQITEAHRI